MSVNTFNLTPASVRAHMFPMWNEFSDSSSPTSSIVTEQISEEAADLASKLYAEGVDAGSILEPTSTAWLWCAKTLRFMVALRVLRSTTQQDPELAKTYARELAARLESLNENGATELGDDSLSPGDPPDGPSSHINVFGLKTDDPKFMSSTAPFLRKDDQL